VKHAVMEVSSHALALKRTFGVQFACAVFTNLSQDHFDFHKDFEDYFQAKRILFTQTNARVVNIDDAYGRRLKDEFSDAMTFGRANADITPEVEVTVRGLHGRLRTPIGDITVESPLIGYPNLSNWMAAAGAAISAGCTREQIEAGIRNLEAVRGRFERVVRQAPSPVMPSSSQAPRPSGRQARAHTTRTCQGAHHGATRPLPITGTGEGACPTFLCSR
jgi:UDP-N-acetylmuramoyl-L-alanyl-D-glutamate--2,6-diaminopimelate ligase